MPKKDSGKVIPLLEFVKTILNQMKGPILLSPLLPQKGPFQMCPKGREETDTDWEANSSPLDGWRVPASMSWRQDKMGRGGKWVGEGTQGMVQAQEAAYMA